MGLVVGRESKLTDVLWGGPAHTAGLTVGTQIIAVDGLAYDGERLKDTVKAAKTNSAAIEFLVKNGDHYSTVHVDYHDGLRYPLLERDANVPARRASLASSLLLAPSSMSVRFFKVMRDSMRKGV